MNLWLALTLTLIAFHCHHRPSSSDDTSESKGSLASSVLVKELESIPGSKQGEITVCSYNISFLGHWKNRKNEEIAELLKNCHLVLVQELVSPPQAVVFPDGNTMAADVEAEVFAAAMKQAGFDGLWLSPDDTGPKQNRISTNASEWWVAFYRKSHLAPNLDHPHGFLIREKSGPANLLLALNPIYSRVPYAFSFDTLHPVSRKKINDFTVISVHLAPDDGKSAAPKRITEFRAILQWAGRMMSTHAERDYLIVGDVNIANLAEYSGFLGKLTSKLQKNVSLIEAQIGNHDDYRGSWRAQLQGKFASLNHSLKGTNLKKEMPYDHIFWMPEHSTEVVPELWLIDTKKRFDKNDQLTHSDFYQQYSDHHPIVYRWRLTPDDD